MHRYADASAHSLRTCKDTQHLQKGYSLERHGHLFVHRLVHLGSVSGSSVLQVDVRSAAVGGRRGDPRRQGARSGAGALRNLWQNMWRNGGEGEPPADGTPAFQQVTPPPLFLCMTCSLSSAALSTACLYVSFESAQPIGLHRDCHEISCMWSSCHSQLDSTEPLSPDLHPTSHSTSDRFLLSVESVHDWVFSVCLLTVLVFECYRQPMSDRW